MLFGIMAQRLAVPSLPVLVLVFFAFSFFGCIMECIVLSVEKKQLVVNRGFTGHLPFCIIYGFGALAGYAILAPLQHNLVLLYLAGAAAATCFEYFVARLQKRLFGSVWWDYSGKFLNFQGVICLESTIFWGFVAVVIIRFLHNGMVGLVSQIPQPWTLVLAIALPAVYALDFVVSARAARAAAKAAYKTQAQNELEYRQST